MNKILIFIIQNIDLKIMKCCLKKREIKNLNTNVFLQRKNEKRCDNFNREKKFNRANRNRLVYGCMQSLSYNLSVVEVELKFVFCLIFSRINRETLIYMIIN